MGGKDQNGVKLSRAYSKFGQKESLCLRLEALHICSIFPLKIASELVISLCQNIKNAQNFHFIIQT